VAERVTSQEGSMKRGRSRDDEQDRLKPRAERDRSCQGIGDLRTAYIQGFLAADVASLATMATPVVHGCTIPNVVGKSLKASKKALTHAHCAVGKISHKTSAKPAGVVLSEKPASGTNVDYGTKARLVVSSGKETGGRGRRGPALYTCDNAPSREERDT
jgi:hypothetical protein